MFVRADTLRALRLARQWTQEVAAHRAGVSDRLIRKAETGRRIDAKSVAALATLYSSAGRPIRPQDLLVNQTVYPAASHRRQSRSSLLDRWLDGIWNSHRLETIDELTANDDFRFHCELGVLTTRAELRQRIQNIWESFSDFDLTCDASADLGDLAVCRWSVRMTHSGLWLGRKPTHCRITATGSTSVRIDAGKIKEGWEFWDSQHAFLELASRTESSENSPDLSLVFR